MTNETVDDNYKSLSHLPIDPTEGPWPTRVGSKNEDFPVFGKKEREMVWTATMWYDAYIMSV